MSKTIRQLHLQGFVDDDPDTFVMGDNIFLELESLEQLSLISLNLGNLVIGITHLPFKAILALIYIKMNVNSDRIHLRYINFDEI